MVYLAPADFRQATLKHWCAGIPLESDVIGDTNLTALIASQSLRFDEYVDDHFEPEAGVTVTVDGRGGARLALPKRIRAVTSVVITDPWGFGSTTTLPATAYMFEPFTGAANQIASPNYLSLTRASGYAYWPRALQSVAVTGDFSWSACPDGVKRAVALLCWEVAGGVKDTYFRYGMSMQIDEGTITTPGPDALSSLPEANRIADQYRRQLVAV